MRTLPRQKLSQSPLIHVVAQLAFSSPVYGIERSLGSLQESLRSVGYSEVVASLEQSIVFTPQGSPESTTAEPRWDFLSDNRLWSVLLTRSMVVLQTSAYDTFEDFSDRLAQVAEIVLTTLSVSKLQRIGLRYIDRIECEAGEQLDQYVDASLLGYPRSLESKLQATRLFSRSDTLLQTPNGMLAIRSLEAPHTALPPDLALSPLTHRPVSTTELPVLILDFDHFRLGSIPATDAQDVIADFWALHDGLDHAFRTVATTFALHKWGQELLKDD